MTTKRMYQKNSKQISTSPESKEKDSPEAARTKYEYYKTLLKTATLDPRTARTVREYLKKLELVLIGEVDRERIDKAIALRAHYHNLLVTGAVRIRGSLWVDVSVKPLMYRKLAQFERTINPLRGSGLILERLNCAD